MSRGLLFTLILSFVVGLKLIGAGYWFVRSTESELNRQIDEEKERMKEAASLAGQNLNESAIDAIPRENVSVWVTSGFQSRMDVAFILRDFWHSFSPFILGLCVTSALIGRSLLVRRRRPA